MRISEEKYNALMNKSTDKKTPKYKNKKLVIDNILFDSKKEANYYTYLKMLEKSGKIKNLELQKKFILQDTFKLNGKSVRQIVYIADFVYEDETGQVHIVDVKSEATKKDKVYRLKKKLFAYKYHIEIEEVV